MGGGGRRVGGVETLLVPLPPLAEQKRIVAELDELMELCDQLESSLEKVTQVRSRLLQAVLHRSLSSEPVRASSALERSEEALLEPA